MAICPCIYFVPTVKAFPGHALQADIRLRTSAHGAAYLEGLQVIQKRKAHQTLRTRNWYESHVMVLTVSQNTSYTEAPGRHCFNIAHIPCFIELCFNTLWRYRAFYKWKVGSNLPSDESTGTISPTAFACSHLCVTFWQFSKPVKVFHYYVCHGDLWSVTRDRTSWKALTASLF